MQASIYLFKPSEGIQSEPLEFFFHPSFLKTTRDNSSQTTETATTITLQTSTLNRRLKRSLQISDEYSTKAKLPSRLRTCLDILPDGKEVKTEPLEAEDSGFCETMAPIRNTFAPTILENR